MYSIIKTYIMNSSEKNAILEIDNQIAQLKKMKEQLLKVKPLSEILNSYIWVIESSCNKYYQFVFTNDDEEVQLSRFGKTLIINKTYFDNNFRVASSCEVKQHIQYLASKDLFFINIDGIFGNGMSGTNMFTPKFDVAATHYSEHLNRCVKMALPKKHMIDPTNCDFYMVTVTGEHGSKVRHTDYNLAINEASRLAKSKNHKAWITGVVAVVEPIQPEIQVKIITK